MDSSCVIAGSGGQGVLMAGEILATALMFEGKNVTYMPVYGVERRGGTSGATVVFSDDVVGSPFVRHPAAAIVMNQPSLDKYEERIAAGGLLVVNTSLARRPIARDDLRVLPLPLNELALQLGNVKVANMIALGAYVACLGVAGMDAMQEALAETLAEGRRHLIEINRRALDVGASLVSEVMP